MSDSTITKKALAQALKDLTKKSPLEKISVSDICEVCQLNRKSFYYHFRDKYDLVEWIFNSEFIATVSHSEMNGRMDFLDLLCGYFYKEREFYIRVFHDRDQNIFLHHFEQYLYQVVETVFRAKSQPCQTIF